MSADDRAIVVGIARYPALTELHGPENDAVAFASWLTDARGGQVPAARVTQILSSQFPAAKDPTTAIIDAAFEQIIDDADQNGGRAGRRLYLFFAGHGIAPSVDESALLMANAARGMSGHHIPGRLYCNWFRTAALFDEVVLLMDCCRDVRTAAPVHAPPWEPRIGVTPSRLFLGFAAEMGSASRERPSQNDANKVRGRFTEAVVAGLRSAIDAGGEVTNVTLPGFVFSALLDEAERNNESPLVRQEPKFQASDPIVFAKVGAPCTLTVTFAGDRPDLLSGDFSQVLQPVEKTATTAQWQLKPGLYLLRRGGETKPVTLLGVGGEERVGFP